MDLSKLFWIALRHWYIVVALAVMGCLGGVFLHDRQAESTVTATVLLAPESGAQRELLIAQPQRYVASQASLVTGRAVMDAAAARLGSDAGSLRAIVSVVPSDVDNTLRIAASDDSADVAQERVTAVVDAYRESAPDVVSVLDEGSVSTAASAPRLVIAGTLGGILIGVMAAAGLSAASGRLLPGDLQRLAAGRATVVPFAVASSQSSGRRRRKIRRAAESSERLMHYVEAVVDTGKVYVVTDADGRTAAAVASELAWRLGEEGFATVLVNLGGDPLAMAGQLPAPASTLDGRDEPRPIGANVWLLEPRGRTAAKLLPQLSAEYDRVVAAIPETPHNATINRHARDSAAILLCVQENGTSANSVTQCLDLLQAEQVPLLVTPVTSS
jgi:hypothetical protein